MFILVFVNAVSHSSNFLDFTNELPELSVTLCDSKHHRTLYATFPAAELRRFILQEDIKSPISPGRIMVKKTAAISFVFVALGRELTEDESDTVIEVMQILGVNKVNTFPPLSLSVLGAEPFLALLSEKIDVEHFDNIKELKLKGV